MRFAKSHRSFTGSFAGSVLVGFCLSVACSSSAPGDPVQDASTSEASTPALEGGPPPGESSDAGADRSTDAATPAITDAGGSTDRGDAGDAANLAASGIITVPTCTGLGGIAESCSFRYLFDPAVCSPARPCNKLVAFYAGGDQNCAGPGYTKVLKAYAAAGYVAACLEIFETSEGSGKEPYFKEADRVDAVLTSYLAYARPAWTGEHLLISGISHGATAPVTAMARTTRDNAWKGSVTTGACFYDGIYDINAEDELMATGADGGQCTAILSHARVVGRYYPSRPLVHSCGNNKCACDPQHAPEMDTDSITAVAPAELAIKKWKLIECGSATPTCAGDVVPAGPIQALCKNIRDNGAASGHECTDDAMPNDTHLVCHHTGIDRCLAWFDGIAH